MGDGEPVTWSSIAFWLGGALVALLQLIGISQIRRIGALEKGKADKADVDRALDKVLDEMRADRAAASVSREILHEKVNKVAISVARLAGRASDDDEE